MAGLGANGVTQVSQLLMRLLEVPILLMLWGAAGYGEWLLIAALPTALSFSDGGFTRTARREMAMRAGRGDGAGIAAVFQSAWVLLLVLSVAVLLLLGLLLPHLPLAQWLKLKSIGDSDLVLVLLALATQVLVYFQCGLLHGAFISRGRYAVGELLIALSAILCFCGMLTGALLGKGIVGAALGSLAGQMAGYGAMLALYVRQISAPRYGIKQASVREIKALWAPSVANLAFPLTDALNTQGVRLVVGLSLGPVALAVFSTTRTLCRMALQPVLSIARTVEPELSLAYGAGHDAQARDLFLRSSHAGFWLSVALSLVVAIVGPLFYQLWAGHELELDRLALCFMLIASVLNVLWGIALTVPCSVNRHTSLSVPFFAVYGGGSVLMVFILSKLGMGTSGAALGILFGDALALGLVVAVALRVGGLRIDEWLKAVVRSPVDVVKQMMSRLKMVLIRSRRRLG
jgi:O-antigen/teichoic acid export membrane protein